MDLNELNGHIIFNKGQKLSNEYFTGTAYLEMLVLPDEVFNCPIGNVTFEPGARNHWHKHPGGQLLLVTDGCGYYQEEGKLPQHLKTGDVVKILPNVKHWHGATADHYFTHLAISTNTDAGEVEWLEEVSDEQYNQV